MQHVKNGSIIRLLAQRGVLQLSGRRGRREQKGGKKKVG